jgi:lysozyme
MANLSPLALGTAGTALIRSFESCGKRLGNGTFAAYPDPATGGAPWTIGWGSTGPDIASGAIWTQAQCDARFVRDTATLAIHVARLVAPAPTSQPQFDALVSLAYNIGLGNLASSTLLARHKAGDHAAAAAQFARWNKAGGQAMAGLTRRRAAEAALYRGAGA